MSYFESFARTTTSRRDYFAGVCAPWRELRRGREAGENAALGGGSSDCRETRPEARTDRVLLLFFLRSFFSLPETGTIRFYKLFVLFFFFNTNILLGSNELRTVNLGLEMTDVCKFFFFIYYLVGVVMQKSEKNIFIL